MHNCEPNLSDVRHLGDWPVEGLSNRDKCPICKSASRVLQYRDLVDQVFLCAPGIWKFYICNDCGTGYLDPCPAEAYLHMAYKNYYTHERSEVTAAYYSLSLIRKLRRRLANGYRNWRYGTELEPYTQLGIVIGTILPWLRQPIDVEMRRLPKMGKDTRGRLLDVGAGNGEFLSKALMAGWKVYGVEPDEAAQRNAVENGLDVRLGGIEAFEDQREFFDAITISHVIEHVHDPKLLVKQAKQILKPGGCLYIETPNILSYGHKKFGRHWLHLDPPRHLLLFNWASLETLVSGCGFSKIQRFVRKDVYRDSAAASKAIAKGCDPLSDKQYARSDYWVSLLVALKTSMNNKDAEFLSITAFK